MLRKEVYYNTIIVLMEVSVGTYLILLVESDDNAMSMMQRCICNYSPDIELVSTSTTGAALELLQRNNYDIVICDAFLLHEDRISFIRDMCDKTAFFLIIITGDTGITAESFTAYLKESYIHHVLYKPLQLQAFLESLRCAILRVKVRREES